MGRTHHCILAHAAAIVVGLCSQVVLCGEDAGPEGDPGARLINALAGEDAVARFVAEEKLVAMGDAAVPALERAAATPGFAPVRQYAINALARGASPKAVAALLGILKREEDVKARGLICRHLGRLGVEEAVEVIGGWLLTIQGKPLTDWDGRQGGDPQILTSAYAWIVHVEALREIGSPEAVPLLEQMLEKRHDGRAGRAFTKACQVNLEELKKQAAFWDAVGRIPRLGEDVKLLFRFFRRDDLALMRLYREKVLRLGVEGRWVLEDMQTHPDARLRQAAAGLLKDYARLRP